MKQLILTLAILSIFQATTLAQTRVDDLRNALSKLDEGTSLLVAHDPQSSPILAEAAAQLEHIIDKDYLKTPGIYHALGNAYMLNGDLGHAVLAYRRGEQLDPSSKELRDSLNHARSLVPISIKPNTQGRIMAMLLSWRGYIGRGTLWLVFITLFTGGWLGCAAGVLNLAPRGIRTLGIWCIAGSVIPIGLLGLEWAQGQGSSSAVITAKDVRAMSGPDDEIYDPVFANALQPGVEARVIETRDSWNRLELGDGTQCWVPLASVELVNK